MATQNIWTYELNASTLSIDDTFGLTAISILCTIGTVTVSGLDVAGGQVSIPVTLTTNQSMTVSTNGSINVLLLDIDATLGKCNLMGIK